MWYVAFVIRKRLRASATGLRAWRPLMGSSEPSEADVEAGTRGAWVVRYRSALRALCESIATRKRRSHRSRGLDWRRTGKGCVSCESKCSPLQSSCVPGTGLAAERQCLFTSWSGSKQSNSSRPAIDRPTRTRKSETRRGR